jgi:hypothetical protein
MQGELILTVTWRCAVVGNGCRSMAKAPETSASSLSSFMMSCRCVSRGASPGTLIALGGILLHAAAVEGIGPSGPSSGTPAIQVRSSAGMASKHLDIYPMPSFLSLHRCSFNFLLQEKFTYIKPCYVREQGYKKRLLMTWKRDNLLSAYNYLHKCSQHFNIP